MPSLETDVLSKLIAEKYDCLVQLHELSRRQIEFIEQDDMPQLMRLLSAKGHLIEVLQTTEKQLDHFRGQDPEARRWRTPTDRQKCAQQAARSEELLAEVVDLEKRSERILANRRDEAATRLQGAHTAHQVRAAYTSAPSSQSKMLDVKE